MKSTCNYDLRFEHNKIVLAEKVLFKMENNGYIFTNGNKSPISLYRARNYKRLKQK